MIESENSEDQGELDIQAPAMPGCLVESDFNRMAKIKPEESHRVQK